MAKRKKFTDKEIINFVSSIDYVFVGFTSKNHRRLLVSCDKGHKYFTTRTNIYNKNRRCKVCSYNNRPKTRKTTNVAKLIIELDKMNYTYINLFNKGGFEYIEYICSNGHKYSTRMYDWIKGVRCGRCKGNIKVTFSKVQQSFIKEGYTLFTKSYKNNTSQLDYSCILGHIGTTNWMRWYSGVRCPVCAIINNSGTNSHLWRGGVTLEAYCDAWQDRQYKYDIRKRDDNVCQNPYCYCTIEKLHIHHIDYDKKNCRKENLITVCNSCNGRANFDRDWHEAWYKAILYKRCGYTY